ncbi:hypothetical protein [Aeromicrobium duanguangcaii]|uniref:hypothetical protein n=1 Tax=Aeromicrobium duanguangcaii TaxID=2968086 RepID=UPI0020176685|nr:hypothetical protein [Aeromicrobium duanguangcaii]MCL3837850.1 hypothetical protein [Aeromicrobium duanguangcaii]
MTTTLTDRYVYAATRWLPGKTRSEVADELRERIGDTVAARGETPEAEREVLEALGDPLRVAADYTGREPALIGPRFFFPWLRLTVVLLCVVGPVVGAIVATVAAFEGEDIGSIITGGLGALVQTSMQVAFWTTVVFAVLDWSGSRLPDTQWSVDRLPEPLQNTGSLGELIATLVFLPLSAVLIVWQQVRPPSIDGERLPLADPDLWSWYLPLLLVVLALEVGHALWIHRAGWTGVTATANLALSLLFAIPTIVLLLDGSLVNPELVAHLDWDSEIVRQVSKGSAFVIALVSLWEILDGYRKAYTATRVPVAAQ